MPNAKGSGRKGKVKPKAKADDEEIIPDVVDADVDMADVDGAEDVEGAQLFPETWH